MERSCCEGGPVEIVSSSATVRGCLLRVEAYATAHDWARIQARTNRGVWHHHRQPAGFGHVSACVRRDNRHAAPRSADHVPVAQLDAILYILSSFEGTTHESRFRAGSRLVETALRTEAGTVSGIHPRLCAGARLPRGRSRSAVPLARHTAIRARDANYPSGASRASHTAYSR
jgi:hypothetical protein